VDDSAQNVIVIIPGANLGLSLLTCRTPPRSPGCGRGGLPARGPVEDDARAFRIAKSAVCGLSSTPAPAAPLPGELAASYGSVRAERPEAETLTGLAVRTGEEVEAAARALRLRRPAGR